MWSIRSFASNAALASALFLAATMLPADVQALPQCGPAVPAEVGVAKLYAYNSWQNYQTASPEDRCCAKLASPSGSMRALSRRTPTR